VCRAAIIGLVLTRRRSEAVQLQASPFAPTDTLETACSSRWTRFRCRTSRGPQARVQRSRVELVVEDHGGGAPRLAGALGRYRTVARGGRSGPVVGACGAATGVRVGMTAVPLTSTKCMPRSRVDHHAGDTFAGLAGRSGELCITEREDATVRGDQPVPLSSAWGHARDGLFRWMEPVDP